MKKPKSKKKSITKPQSNFKKDIIKRFAYLLLCVIPIFLLAEEKSNLRLIVLPFLLLGGLQFIYLGNLGIRVINHYFPTQTYNSQKTIGEKVLYYGCYVYMIGFFYAIIMLGRMENVIGEWEFFWKYAFIGLCIAILVLFVLRWVVSTVYEDYYRRMTLCFIVPLTTMLLAAALAFQYNATVDRKKYHVSNYKVIEKHKSGRSSQNYSLNIQTSFGEETIKVSKQFYDSSFVGSTLQLRCYEGALGYEVVNEMHVK